jgi:hypothetical protein
VDRISTGPEPECETSVVFLPKGGRHAIKDAPATPAVPVEQIFGGCDRAKRTGSLDPAFQTAPEPLTHDNCYDGGRRLRSFERNAFPEHRVDSAIMEHEMSKVAVPRSKSARKTPRKSARIALSSRRRRSKSEDRLDGMAAANALKESAERIPYQKARRDLDL